MKTTIPYIIENLMIDKDTNIRIQEDFNISYIPDAAQKVVNILSRRLGIDIGIDPFPMTSSMGGIAYKIVLDGYMDYAFTLEFNGNSLSRIGQLEDYFSDSPDTYLDLNGYNIVETLGEIESVLQNFVATGDFALPDDYFDPEEERSELTEAVLAERIATAQNAFDLWIKENKKEAERLLVQERLIKVYRDVYTPWAADNVDELMSNVSFFNMAKKWLAKNKLENEYAHKSLIINEGGKLEYVENPTDIKNWKDMLTTSYNDQFELMNSMIDGVVAGGFNAIAIFGPPGVGKTYLTQKYLNSLGIDYFTATGAIKDVRALVQVLYEHRDDKIVIFDDLNLTNKAFREVILAALDDKFSRNISYFDTKAMNAPKTKKIPEQFEFSAGVIYISNNPRIDPAIKSRAVSIELNFSQEEKMSLIYDSLKEVAPSIPMAIKEEVFEFMLEIIGDLKLIDFRKFKQAIGLYSVMKGDPSKWKPAVKKILG